MAAVTICSDFGAPKYSLSLFPLFPHLFAMKWWDQMPWSSLSECWALSQLFHSPLSLSSTGFLVPLHFYSFSIFVALVVHACMLSRFSQVLLFVTLWSISRQAFLSMEFFRQKYWSELPCPSPEDLPSPGFEPVFLTSPALAGGFVTTSTIWEAPSGQF